VIARAWRLLRAVVAFNLRARHWRAHDWRRVPRPIWAAKRGGVEVW